MNQILVIDDYEANLTLYAKVISQVANTRTVSFTVSKDALVWAEANEPALVVVDQNMPDPSGLEFIRLYRELPGRSDTPIIMITGTQDRSLRREALRRGASAFLNKPVDPIELLSYASNFIESRAIRVALAMRVDEQERARIQTLLRVLGSRDERLAVHGELVASIAGAIALHAGLAEADIEAITIAASVHDVGKIGIPDRILFKPAALTPEERDVARSHARAGAEVLRDAENRLAALAAEIALTHHERFDGNGYPAGLSGEAIPICGRIVAIADAFAAMTRSRPWREALSHDAAREEIDADAGTKYDPRLVTALHAVFAAPNPKASIDSA